MKGQQCCWNCTFWFPEKSKKNWAEVNGACGRYPPRVVNSIAGVVTLAPTTQGSLWCGEWRSSNAKSEQVITGDN